LGRGAVALLVGLAGFVAYLLVVLELAALVAGAHWAVELLFFAAAGVVWALPAARLIRWAVGGRARR
jgi:hypothetical protein